MNGTTLVRFRASELFRYFKYLSFQKPEYVTVGDGDL